MVHRDGADGVVGDGHRAAARRADAETGAADSRRGDGNGTRAGAAADSVARHRADVDVARRHVNPAPHAGQRGGGAAARPDDVRDGIPLHAARRVEPDALEQIRRRSAGRRPLLGRHGRAGRITADEVAGDGVVAAPGDKDGVTVCATAVRVAVW